MSHYEYEREEGTVTGFVVGVFATIIVALVIWAIADERVCEVTETRYEQS